MTCGPFASQYPTVRVMNAMSLGDLRGERSLLEGVIRMAFWRWHLGCALRRRLVLDISGGGTAEQSHGGGV